MVDLWRLQMVLHNWWCIQFHSKVRRRSLHLLSYVHTRLLHAFVLLFSGYDCSSWIYVKYGSNTLLVAKMYDWITAYADWHSTTCSQLHPHVLHHEQFHTTLAMWKQLHYRLFLPTLSQHLIWLGKDSFKHFYQWAPVFIASPREPHRIFAKHRRAVKWLTYVWRHLHDGTCRFSPINKLPWNKLKKWKCWRPFSTLWHGWFASLKGILDSVDFHCTMSLLAQLSRVMAHSMPVTWKFW